LIGGGDFGEVSGAEQLCGEYHYFLIIQSFRLAFLWIALYFRKFKNNC